MQGFILQNSFTRPAHFAAALTFDPQQHTTLALVAGLKKHEILHICTRLRYSQDYITLPMLLPALLLELRVDSATRTVADSHREIYNIEQETGLRTDFGFSNDSARDPSDSKQWETNDFNRISRQLTSVTAKLAHCISMCQMHLPMIDELDLVNQEAVNSSPPGRESDLQRVNACLRANNALLRGWLQATLFRATYLSQRAQAQVQTVSKIEWTRRAKY